MPDILIDGSFYHPTPVGARRTEYPFRNNGDRATALFDEEYWQRVETFVPQEQPIQHEQLRDFYLVKETDPVEFMGGMLKFTRSYSRVPSQQVEYSSILIAMPEPGAAGSRETSFRYAGNSDLQGVNGYVTPNWAFARGGFYSPIKVATSNRDNGVMTIPNHGMVANAPLLVVYEYKTSGSNAATDATWLLQQWDASQWTNTNANAITLNANLAQGTYTAFLGVAQFNRAGLGSGSRYVACKRVTDYYLPGVSSGISTPADIPIPSDQSNSEDFIAALLAGTGTINVRVGEIARWRDSLIHYITKTTVEIVNLV